LRIELDGVTILSRKYESFDDLTDEFIEYEDQHGRRVPDYDIGVILGAVALFLLGRVADKLISEAFEWRRRRVQGELEEKRHSELITKLDELKQTRQQAVEAQPPQSALTGDAAAVSALLQWAKKENMAINITLETEAEGDLREAFETLTKDVPGSSVRD
jgi:hypothetical protein